MIKFTVYTFIVYLCYLWGFLFPGFSISPLLAKACSLKMRSLCLAWSSLLTDLTSEFQGLPAGLLHLKAPSIFNLYAWHFCDWKIWDRGLGGNCLWLQSWQCVEPGFKCSSFNSQSELPSIMLLLFLGVILGPKQVSRGSDWNKNLRQVEQEE